MSTCKETMDLLDVVAKVLLRCTIFGFVLFLLWLAGYVLAPEMINRQGKWFDLTPHEVALIHYCGMAFVKFCVLLFFLFPYVAIRMVLRSKISSADSR